MNGRMSSGAGGRYAWAAMALESAAAIAVAAALALVAMIGAADAAPGSQAVAAPAPASPASPAAPAPALVSHGRFKKVAVFAPQGTPSGVVLFLSGESGWSSGDAALARELARHGALVAGIDGPKLAADFEADADECVFPDGDLENFSHFLQAYYRLPTYVTPLLMGQGSGASLAYGALAQAPAGTFAGALTLGFCPAASLRKPLCKGSGVLYAHRPGVRQPEFLPAARLANPWVLLQGERDQACGTQTAEAFIAQHAGRGARETAGAGAWHRTGRSLAAAGARRLRFPGGPRRRRAAAGAARGLGRPADHRGARCRRPGSLADSFAIVLSGDGGWAGLDKDVAQALSAAGIPVVGLDSLRYFWSPRTPEGLAADIDRLIRYYLAHWSKSRVLLIGYSQGADVLPFAVNRLPAETRARVALTALMGMSEHALFEFHLSSWISDSSSGLPTLPEVERMSGARVECIYGEDESDSLCPKLDPKRVLAVRRKGGHHFDGDYAGLARAILDAVQP